jgi:hypothetical protein
MLETPPIFWASFAGLSEESKHEAKHKELPTPRLSLFRDKISRPAKLLVRSGAQIRHPPLDIAGQYLGCDLPVTLCYVNLVHHQPANNMHQRTKYDDRYPTIIRQLRSSFERESLSPRQSPLAKPPYSLPP